MNVMEKNFLKKKSNIQIIGIPEIQEKKNGSETRFEEI